MKGKPQALLRRDNLKNAENGKVSGIGCHQTTDASAVKDRRKMRIKDSLASKIELTHPGKTLAKAVTRGFDYSDGGVREEAFDPVQPSHWPSKSSSASSD
jgi:hypothetical protein